MEVQVIIGLGSNLGNRVKHLKNALVQLTNHLQVVSLSSYYESEPMGYLSSLNFLNLVAIFRSELHYDQLADLINKIEDLHGRKRTAGQHQDRTLDLDILFYGEEIIEENGFVIPHERLHLRNFVLDPLMEIAPNFIHPKFQKTIIDLYAHCTDVNPVFPYLP